MLTDLSPMATAAAYGSGALVMLVVGAGVTAWVCHVLQWVLPGEKR